MAVNLIDGSAERGADAIRHASETYQPEFNAITVRAKAHFDQRDWT